MGFTAFTIYGKKLKMLSRKSEIYTIKLNRTKILRITCLCFSMESGHCWYVAMIQQTALVSGTHMVQVL